MRQQRRILLGVCMLSLGLFLLGFYWLLLGVLKNNGVCNPATCNVEIEVGAGGGAMLAACALLLAVVLVGRKWEAKNSSEAGGSQEGSRPN